MASVALAAARLTLTCTGLDGFGQGEKALLELQTAILSDH